METLILIVGIIILIAGPLTVAVAVSNYGMAQERKKIKRLALEEKRCHWLVYMGLKETRLYFNSYGLGVITIWGNTVTNVL